MLACAGAFMDGDGQHPPTLVETLVGYWLDQGHDVVSHRQGPSRNEPGCAGSAARRSMG
jgi:hypothetical protein